MTTASVRLSVPYETSWVDLLCWRRESRGIAARGKSGLRWTIDQMGAGLACEVQREVLDRLAAKGVEWVETNVIYAIAEKPSGLA